MISPSTILRLEALRFTFKPIEWLVFDRVADVAMDEPGALVVQADYVDLADVVSRRPDKVGSALRDLAMNEVLLPLDWRSQEGALRLAVNFNFAQWKAKPRRDRAAHWRRVNRLLASNGLQGWLIDREQDLNSQLPETYRENFIERVRCVNGSRVSVQGFDSKATVSTVSTGATVSSGAGVLPGALNPNSGLMAPVRAVDPKSGCEEKADGHCGLSSSTPNQGIRVESSSSKKEGLTRVRLDSKGNPESGLAAAEPSAAGPEVAAQPDQDWMADPYITEKLNMGRAAVLRSELAQGVTATARQFRDIYGADADRARMIIGQAASLPHLNWRTGRPTDVARWFNRTVADWFGKIFREEVSR